MIKKNKLTWRVSIFVLAAFVSSLIAFTYKARSDEEKVPVLKVTTSQSTITAGVNEEFSVTYHVEPQPIPVDKISPQTEKEIVLVIDTSGSMATALDSKNTRIAALKTAAKNFVDKFAGNDKVYLGIVNYDTYSTVVTKNNTYTDGFINTSTSNVSTIKGFIDNNLDAEGGTNIGEGIRRALSLLNRNNNRKKYVIVMSDGEPTALSYTGEAGYYNNKNKYVIDEEYDYSNKFWAWGSNFDENSYKWNYYTSFNDNASTMKFGGIYSNQTDPGWCLKYSNIMSTQIKQKGYTSYFIGFSSESNANKMSQIATSAGGSYVSALDATAIDKVYSNIADQIKADYMVEQVNFNFNVPTNLTYTGSQLNLKINGTAYSKQLSNIVYTLNSAKTYYTADAFDIIINFKASKSGTYNLTSSGGWNISYETVNGTVVNELAPNVNIVVSSVNLGFTLSRNITGSTTNAFNINNEFQMQYNITPTGVSTSASIKGKEIVLVVDTSTSMAQSLSGGTAAASSDQKLSVVKEMSKNFVDALKSNPNVKVGLVTFNKGAAVCDFGSSVYLTPSSNASTIKSKIDSIALTSSTNEGSNVGEGIRKALWLLSQNSTTNKYIVVISDGAADYYSYDKSSPANYYTVLNNESDAGAKVGYSLGNTAQAEGGTKGELYSKSMAQTIKNNASQVINSYFISLGSNADTTLLSALSTTAGGNYVDSTANDKSVLNTNLINIADTARSEFIIKDSTLTETLPEGLQFSDGSKVGQVTFPKLVYVYNTTTKQYESEAVNALLTVKGVKLGSYALTNDAVFNYKNLEGNSTDKFFGAYSLTIKDDTVLKQGIFISNPTNKTIIGESYLDANLSDVADNFITKVASYVRTTGQPTTLEITLKTVNKVVSSGAAGIDLSSIKIYEIDSNNNLTEKSDIEKTIKITQTDKSSCNIIVSIPSGSTSTYNNYLINYNFKTVGDADNGYYVNCSAKIQETGKSSNLQLNAVGLPDLF